MDLTVSTHWIARLHKAADRNSRRILLLITVILVTIIIVPPIGMLLFSSIRSTKGLMPFETTSFTIQNYIEVFTSESTYRLLLNTTWYAVGTVLLSMAITVTLAWFLERTDVPLRRTLFVLMLAPLGMPVIILCMAWTALANPANGVINVVLRAILGLQGPGPLDIYSIPGMILVSSLSFVPQIYIMISGVFGRIDPSFEEAGRTSGAGSLAVFRYISLPVLGPALISAVIFFLVRAMELFEIPAMLGFPRGIYVLSSAIYYAIHPVTGSVLPDYGSASTYSVVLLLVAGVFIYFYGHYVRHAERFATVTGRGYRPRLIVLGKWKFVPVLLMLTYFFLAIALPLLVLLWTSLAPRFSSISLQTLSLLNFNFYRHMLNYPYLMTTVKNTLIVSAASAGGGMLLVTVISWLSVRGGIRGSSIPDRLSFLIIAVPSVVLGLSLIFVYASLPFSFYGTIWIIVLGFITLNIPFGTRQMSAALLQVHRELEEASATSGAGLLPTIFHIVLPLLWPSFARGFLGLFVRCLSTTTLALMLFTVDNQIIGVTLWFLWVEDARMGLASAIAVPLMIVSMLLTLLVASQTMIRGGD
jgi:iron(III) transport system permease protein